MSFQENFPITYGALEYSKNTVEGFKLYSSQKSFMSYWAKPESTSFGMLWEMGTGKTLAAIIGLMMKTDQEGRNLRTVIVAPVITLVNWQRELEKFSHFTEQHNIQILTGTGKARLKKLETAIAAGKNIIITNYAAVVNADIKSKLRRWNPEFVIGDEIHRIKTPKSKRTKAVMEISLGATYKLALTGTLSPNSLVDMFMPFKFLDDALFGGNYYAFRSKYMYDKNAAWSHRNDYFPKFVPNELMLPDLHEKMATIASRVAKTDVITDLPPLLKIRAAIPMSPEQKKLYEQVKRDCIAFVESELQAGVPKAVVAKLAIVKTMKLQQILSGFVKTEDGETIVLKTNPRAEYLKGKVEELVENGNSIILWHHYKQDRITLANMCKDLGIDYEILEGTNKQNAMDRFNNKEVPVIIANRRSGGIGVNLVVAGYSFVFSRDWSYENDAQSEARNWRGGSQIHDQIIRVDLYCEDTIEVGLLEALENKESLSKKLVDNLKDLL